MLQSMLINRLEVLDASLGRPAANISVSLHELDCTTYQATVIAEGYSNVILLAHATHVMPCVVSNRLTDSDGRCTTLLPSSTKLAAGIYKLQFKTKEYFEQSGRDAFYPVVEV